MRNPRSIAVIGVTGYSGFELATLLLRHPAISKPTFYVREPNGNRCLSQLFPLPSQTTASVGSISSRAET